MSATTDTLTRLSDVDERIAQLLADKDADGLDDNTEDELRRLSLEARVLDDRADRELRAAARDQASRDQAANYPGHLGDNGSPRTTVRDVAADFVRNIDEAGSARDFGLRYQARDLWATGPAGDGQPLLVPGYQPGIVPDLKEPVGLPGLFNIQSADVDAIIYFEQTGFTNSAAFIADRDSGDFTRLPQSSITTAEKTATAGVVGHRFRVAEKMLRRLDYIEALLNSEARYGIDVRLEEALIAPEKVANGPDTLLGPSAQRRWAGNPAGDPGERAEQIMSEVRKAKTDARLALVPADFVVLSPDDLETLDLWQGANGQFLQANPFSYGAARTLWGLTIVESRALENRTAPTFVVGSTQGARLWRTTFAGVEWGYDGEDFSRNARTLKAYEEYLVENYRPEAMVEVRFAEEPATTPTPTA